MGKPVYRIVDGRGRVYLPAECRETAGIGSGDIVRLEARQGQITARRVELIEVGDNTPEALAAYILAGMPYLTDGQLQEVVAQMLKCLQKKQMGGNTVEHENEV